MKRILVLVSLLAIGSLSIRLAAVQQPSNDQSAARVIEVEKLKDNLFLLKGGGGNTAVFVRSAGVVVVDTKNPGWGRPILDKIREITPKPVTLIINTHTHADHVSGNVEFPATVDVVVQENTAVSMTHMNAAVGSTNPTPRPDFFAQHGGRGLAKHTFKERLTLGSGADRVELYYFGRGHTNGDAWVLFPALRVVHAGDMFAWNDRLPLIDVSNGGSGTEIAASLMRGYDTLKGIADTIITGHSTVMTFDDLRRWADFNRNFVTYVSDGKKAGKTADALAAAYVAPAGFQPMTSDAMQTRLKATVLTVFNELK